MIGGEKAIAHSHALYPDKLVNATVSRKLLIISKGMICRHMGVNETQLFGGDMSRVYIEQSQMQFQLPKPAFETIKKLHRDILDWMYS